MEKERREEERQRREQERREEQARQKLLEEQRKLEAEREEQRVRDNWRWLNERLRSARMDIIPKQNVRFEAWNLRNTVNTAEIASRKNKLEAELRDSRPTILPVLDKNQREQLLFFLQNTWTDRLRDYDELRSAIAGLQGFVLRSGETRYLSLDKVVITDRQLIRYLLSDRGKYRFYQRVQSLQNDVQNRIRFWQGVSTQTLVNHYLFLGNVTLEIEADATKHGSEVSLTNITIVGGCDMFEAHKEPDVARLMRRPLYETANAVLSAIPGVAYKIEFRGSQRVSSDVVVQVPPAGTEPQHNPPTCILH